MGCAFVPVYDENEIEKIKVASLISILSTLCYYAEFSYNNCGKSAKYAVFHLGVHSHNSQII
jgi:hypothetical protein